MCTDNSHNALTMEALTIQRTLPAAPDKIWRHLTNENSLATWFWPPELEAHCEIQPELGGYYRIASVNAGLAVYGYFLEFEPTDRYVKTWAWEGEEAETQVEVTLHETTPGVTELTLRHAGHTTHEASASHRTGWTDCLARLETRLQKIATAAVATEQDILDAVGQSMDQGYSLFTEDELSPEFFDLNTGLLGELFQKFTNYQLRLAIILPDPKIHGPRIAELAYEHRTHKSLRFFPTEKEAQNWLNHAD